LAKEQQMPSHSEYMIQHGEDKWLDGFILGTLGGILVSSFIFMIILL
jgi:hypothetical protein